MKTLDEIIIKPLISEKSMNEASTGRYSFIVSKDADKTAIKKAVKKLFNVDATGINTNIIKGSKTKLNRFGKKTNKFSFKKARIQVKKGQKIGLFEEVAKEK